MEPKAHIILLAVGISVLLGGTADAQVLTWDEVQAFDWSGSIPVKLKAATDGVFDEGPDYWYDCEDEWFCESDVILDRYDFPMAIYNNRQRPVDDLIVLLAFKEGTFTSIEIGGWPVTQADFYDNVGHPFGPAGNRPGNGESALYNGAEGVVFVRLGLAVAAKDTVEFPVRINRGLGVLVIHFDFYALTLEDRWTDDSSADSQRKDSAAGGDQDPARPFVACTNAGSHDVTWDTPCYPSTTAQTTWSRIKTFLQPRESGESRAP